ncbi:MAG: FMN-dependent NADH-azoreductase [Rubritepida sp.]|nr:FMN-dependent NADH-azoreductase [Rubritepida sp.]
MKLLHIDSSILGANSVSRPIGAAIVERLRQAEPALEVTTRDLAAEPLAHQSLSNLAKDHPFAAQDGAGSADSDASQVALDEFLTADIVVIGAPMYNFTIASQLKAWIDRILVPGKTFSYSEKGVEGLAAGKRVIIVVSRGGLYGAGMPSAPAEHAESYLRAVFGFIGVTDLEIIVAEGIQMGPDQRAEALKGGLQAAAALRAA